jgi:hypothetical protein
MPSARPIYSTLDNVKQRLAGKVQFQRRSGVVEEGEMSDDLLAQLIVDAETEVEADLSSRYAVPFVTIQGGPFRTLPDHSQRAIRTAVEFKAVILILGTDFGRSSPVNGEGYLRFASEQYETYVRKLLGQNQEGANAGRFKYAPPIEGLRLAPHNREADDGYRGMLINTDQSTRDSVSTAIEQVSGRIPGKRRLPPIGGSFR